jgi:hypothetical protein
MEEKEISIRTVSSPSLSSSSSIPTAESEEASGRKYSFPPYRVTVLRRLIVVDNRPRSLSLNIWSFQTVSSPPNFENQHLRKKFQSTKSSLSHPLLTPTNKLTLAFVVV